MKNGFRNFHILTVILIIAISQIMCNMPQKEDAIQPPVNAADLPEILAGVHDVTITEVKNNCPDHIEIPEFGPVESFEFTSDGVNVNTPKGKLWFGQVEDHRYCHLEVGQQMMCISNLSETGYVLTGYQEQPDGSGSYRSEECYSATHILTSTIDELLIEETIHENPVTDAHSEPELQPDPEPQDCNASTYIQVSGGVESEPENCHCAYRLTFENVHPSNEITILLKKSIDEGAGPVTRWEMKTIAPGKSYTWKSDVDGACKLHVVDAISAIYNTSACHDIRRSKPDEVNAMAEPVTILCNEWSPKGE